MRFRDATVAPAAAGRAVSCENLESAGSVSESWRIKAICLG